MVAVLRQLFGEPLLQFFLLGGLLFALFAWERAGTSPDENEIVVTAGDVDRIAVNFAATWQRSPSETELQAAIEDFIREEMLYRTGLSLGLDKDDPIVRRRIRQKMEFFMEDTVSAPGDEELRSYFQSHSEKFRSEPRIAFRQVFVSLSRSNSRADAEAMLPRLVGAGDHLEEMGDPLLLPGSFPLTDLRQIRSQFGEAFADGLRAIPTGRWSGPLTSAYGFHLVLVTALEPSRLPEFESMRKVVQREWFAERRSAAMEDHNRQLRSRFVVRVEPPVMEPAAE